MSAGSTTLALAVLAGAWLSAGCHEPHAPVTLRFRALIHGQPFSCEETYSGLGGSQSQVAFSDLRMYVSEVALLRGGRERVPVRLTPDGRFQSETVALLDFENQRGSCSSGTQATHVQIQGTAPEGHYRGIELTLGVPFAQNHQDVSTAPAPLDVSSMFWVWRSGYKFLRLDGSTQGAGPVRRFAVHVGSTGCEAASPIDAARTCSHPNRPRIRIDGFDTEHHSIDFHLDRLLAGLSLEDEGNGCESDPNDPDCGPVFEALGLTGRPNIFATLGESR